MALEDILKTPLAARFRQANLPYSALASAREAAYTFFQQERMFDTRLDSAKSWEICADKMIGYADKKKEILNYFNEFAKECASNLYDFESDNISIKNAFVMTNASNLPVKVELEISDGKNKISKTMYIKPFDPVRLIGLELYSTLSGIEDDYRFIFSNSVIVEDSADGKHEFELKDNSILFTNIYKEKRIESDLLSFNLGLDDLSKRDNYVIAPDGAVTIIDFDVMDREYAKEDISSIKRQTAEELGITINEYEQIYQKKERMLRDNLVRNISPIKVLLTLLDSPESCSIREYINKNMNNILSKG